MPPWKARQTYRVFRHLPCGKDAVIMISPSRFSDFEADGITSIIRGITANLVAGQKNFSSAPGLRAGLLSDLSAGDTRLPTAIERSCQDFRPVDLRWQKEVTWVTRQWRAGLPLWHSRLRGAAASPTDKSQRDGALPAVASEKPSCPGLLSCYMFSSSDPPGAAPFNTFSNRISLPEMIDAVEALSVSCIAGR